MSSLYLLNVVMNVSREISADFREIIIIFSGVYTVKIPKLVPGEEFSDLDLLSKLLQPKRTTPKSRIEVIDSENLEDSEEDEEEAIQNWEIEQSIVNEEKDLVQSRIPWVHYV